MKVSHISASEMQMLERMDAKFLLLYKEHEAAFHDLMKWEVVELIEFAQLLPLDTYSAQVVISKFGKSGHALDITRSGLDRWLEGFTSPLCAATRRKTDLAVYCAAAAQFAVAWKLQEAEDLRKKELALIREASALVMRAAEKKADGLLAALKSSGHHSFRGPAGNATRSTLVEEEVHGDQDAERGEDAGEEREEDHPSQE